MDKFARVKPYYLTLYKHHCADWNLGSPERSRSSSRTRLLLYIRGCSINVSLSETFQVLSNLTIKYI